MVTGRRMDGGQTALTYCMWVIRKPSDVCNSIDNSVVVLKLFMDKMPFTKVIFVITHGCLYSKKNMAQF